jgi:sterol desaturase/sphingolipid hydroxylase (fatty acid hydroxylase superfamily)
MVPTEFNVRFLLGKIYMQLRQKNLAIKQLTFSIELDPKAIHVIKKLLEQLHHLHHQQPVSSSSTAAASSSVQLSLFFFGIHWLGLLTKDG